MLLYSKSFTKDMYIIITVQPLLVCQTNKALDKPCTPGLNGATGIVPVEHWFDHNNERVWNSTFHEAMPS